MRHGINRLYDWSFTQGLQQKLFERRKKIPDLIDAKISPLPRRLLEFDDLFTAPLHGFKSTEDYWTRASAKPHLARLRIPTLVLNALNDPFVPASSLPTAVEAGAHATLWHPAHGGHVGFPGGAWPGHVQTMPRAVLAWLREHA